MNLHSYGRLWADHAARSVCLLQHDQVELMWDRVVLVMRRADLIVLHTALRRWLIEEKTEKSAAYLLTLKLARNQCRLCIEGEDLAHLCALMAEAAAQCPRQFVRWADLRVHIVPLPTDTERDLDFDDN